MLQRPSMFCGEAAHVAPLACQKARVPPSDPIDGTDAWLLA